ncbi:response regulator [Salegentibacter mishustinae]|uniref:response regulator n=1 Tax=Salegentibacter mishustinae TaxID=270918 RepID=UPI001CE0D89C|nr:response regulator [Salegentibacter mishustinae]UBZ08781.1 response regulator [Salegentibacter mishustinae]
MKILLVEDDEDKRSRIAEFIKNELEANIDIARSFQSGRKSISEKKYDLILLDMSMPTFDISPLESGGRSQPFGGRTLLFEMQRRNINTKVVVITQFDFFGVDDEEITLEELDLELKNSFSQNYLGAVPFNIGYEDWKENLLKKIKNV